MIQIIQLLKERNKTIATMESCTGGGVANAITNIEGASEVLKFSAVTYSNEYKIKMGVSSEVIDKYSVYSMETAVEMSKNISDFANSDYGIGITGKLNRVDKDNPFGKDNVVFISIYDRENDKYFNFSREVGLESRELNKAYIIREIANNLSSVILENKLFGEIFSAKIIQ